MFMINGAGYLDFGLCRFWLHLPDLNLQCEEVHNRNFNYGKIAIWLIQINAPKISSPTKHTAFNAAPKPNSLVEAQLPKVLSEHKLLLIRGYAFCRIDP